MCFNAFQGSALGNDSGGGGRSYHRRQIDRPDCSQTKKKFKTKTKGFFPFVRVFARVHQQYLPFSAAESVSQVVPESGRPMDLGSERGRRARGSFRAQVCYSKQLQSCWNRAFLSLG